MISIHAPRTGSDAWREPSAATHSDFNPRSPHGERRISPLLGGDMSRFQSTLPARGATGGGSVAQRYGCISIHAPRTGSDPARRCCSRQPPDFNPRSPHGERPASPLSSSILRMISIHAPRTGSDLATSSGCLPSTDFNPRSPHGERPSSATGFVASPVISIHAPRTGSDQCRASALTT